MTVSENLGPVPPLPHAGLIAGPLVAWRAWKIGLREETLLPTLCAIGLKMDTEWVHAQPTHAACYSGVAHRLRVGEIDSLPWRGCGCGLWACKTLASLRARFPYIPPPVIGRVALWGRMIEHREGYRAEWGYPVELWMPALVPEMPGFPVAPVLPRFAQGLRDGYGVPVHGGWPEER